MNQPNKSILLALAPIMLPKMIDRMEGELEELIQTGTLSIETFKRKQELEELIFKAKWSLKQIEEAEQDAIADEAIDKVIPEEEPTQSETDIKLSQWKDGSNEADYFQQLVEQIRTNHEAPDFKASQFTHTDSLPVPIVQYAMASMMSNTRHNVVAVRSESGTELVVALGKPNSDEWVTNLDKPLEV